MNLLAKLVMMKVIVNAQMEQRRALMHAQLQHQIVQGNVLVVKLVQIKEMNVAVYANKLFNN